MTFTRLPCETEELLARCAAVVERAVPLGVLTHVGRGPQAAAIAQLDAFVRDHALDPALTLSRISEGLGALLRDLIAQAGLRRVAVAGGDTSGHAVQVQVLGRSAMRRRAPLTPGAPLCAGVRDVGRAAAIEIALKGGQMRVRPLFRIGGRRPAARLNPSPRVISHTTGAWP